MNGSRGWLLLALLLPGVASAADWTNWRGPENNGVSHEFPLPKSWSPEGENLIWKQPFGCRSTPIVMKGRVFIINYTADKVKGKDVNITVQERIMCLEETTGKIIWEYVFPVFHTDIVTVRLGWTNMTADPATGYLYAHGTQGFLFCLDGMAKKPEVIWQRQLTEEFGRITGYGGRVTSPALFEDLLIMGLVNSSWGDQAKTGNRFVAFDKRTGEVAWWATPPGIPKDTYYSVPIVARIGGQDLVLSGSCEGSIHAIKARTGEVVWSYKFGSGSVNGAPVAEGDRIYIGHGEENPESGNTAQGRVICLDGGKVVKGKPQLVWEHDDIKARYTSPIIHQNKLYITDDIGKLYCLNANDGKLIWKFGYGRDSRGSPTLGDGKIYIGEVNSKFHILDVSGAKCKRLHQQFFPAPPGTDADIEINGTPAIANGRVFFATSDEIFCIGLKDVKPAPEPKIAVRADRIPGKPAHLQIIPADATTTPGGKVKFKLRTFDDQGFLVGEVDASKAAWSLPQPPPPPMPPGAKAPPALDGAVKDGMLTIDAKKSAQQGFVMAKLGDLSAQARVRVEPVLPYAQDFKKIPDGAPPAGWVNAAGKFYVDTVNGQKVLRKVTNNPIPFFAGANTYIASPKSKDYVIECDLLGGKVEDNLPDMGIVNSRYTLVLAGNIHKLRIVSYDALPRIDSTVQFDWKPDVWYRLKLAVDYKGGQAIVKGKAWERSKPEPTEWTVQAIDPRPIHEGAPALFGSVTGIPATGGNGTDIMYANLRITPK